MYVNSFLMFYDNFFINQLKQSLPYEVTRKARKLADEILRLYDG